METKAETTSRLRNEGRWDDACRFREQARERLKAEGKTRKEAREEAWQLMAEEFPPLPVEQAEESDQAEFEPNFESDDDADVDLVRDIIWVYGKIEHKNVSPADAPSHGAWSLLAWARKYRTQFFEKMLDRALAKQNETDDKETVTHSKIALDQCEKLLSEITDKYQTTCPSCGTDYHHVPPGSD